MTTTIIYIILVAIGMNILGAVWFGPLFGKVWMKIHNQTGESIKKIPMASVYVTNILITIISASAFFMLTREGDVSPFQLALAVWFFFIVPMQINSVIWGGDDRKWWVKKIAISLGYHFLAVLFAVYAFTFLK